MSSVTSEEWYKSPVYVLAAGIAAAVLAAAVLWGVSKVIPAVGVAVGLGFSVATTGLATQWVLPAGLHRWPLARSR